MQLIFPCDSSSLSPSLMENIASDLQISELKQSSLCKLYEKIHSQASDVLVFSLQWKDLESHFDSTRKSLQTGLENLSGREKDVTFREKELEARESRFHSDFAAKKKELERIENLIEERSKEFDLNRQHLDSLKSLIQENCEELEVKEKHYEAIHKSVAEKDKEFDHIRRRVEQEEAKFESVKSSVKRVEEKLLAMERKVKQKTEEAESKEKEVVMIRKTLRGYKDDVDEVRRSIEERKKEAELKEEQLRACQSSMEECNKEIKLKEEKLNGIKNSITECSNELESKEKRLEFVRKDVELKEKSFVLLKNSVDQCAKEFERKEREIESLLKELESKEKSCESKIEEVNLIHNKVNDCLKEVESRENNVDSLQKSAEKCSHGLQIRERQFRKRVSEFELRRREFNSSQKSTTEVRANENANMPHSHSQVKIEPLEHAHMNSAIVPSTLSNQNLVAREGKDLQVLLSRHLKTHDLVCKEVSNILRASTDPAKLVLDAMEGFHPSQSSGEASEFDLKIVRRSCILLLEQLMEASPQISPQVKEEAMKIASDWMAKIMVTKNYLEGLGIVQFLTSYKLVSAFNVNELRTLLDVVGLHGLSSELRQALSTADKALIVPKMEQAAENSLADVMTSYSSNPSASVIYKISKFLETSPDPARHVLDYIERSFSHNWKTGNVANEASFRSHCIHLFEQLLRISPQFQPLVRSDAMKLAVKWKENVLANSEDPWDIFNFLQFLHTYGLFFSFDNDDILKLLEMISRREDDLGVCRALKFADAIPEFIQNLIRKKKPIDAVSLICAFKLTDNHKFSPVSLLTQYMKDLKDSTFKNCKGKRPIEEKDKATDEEIAALETVIKCINENAPNLSNLSVGQILKRINMLQHAKKQRRQSLHLLQPKAEQEHKQHHEEQQVWRKRGRDIPPHHGEPHQGRNKFHRTSSSNHKLHFPPTFVPNVRQPEFRSNSAFGRDHPRQFSLGGSSNMVGSNFDAARRC